MNNDDHDGGDNPIIFLFGDGQWLNAFKDIAKDFCATKIVYYKDCFENRPSLIFDKKKPAALKNFAYHLKMQSKTIPVLVLGCPIFLSDKVRLTLYNAYSVWIGDNPRDEELIHFDKVQGFAQKSFYEDCRNILAVLTKPIEMVGSKTNQETNFV